MLSLHGLRIGYGTRVLATVPESTTVRAGEFICLLGRNGQGKSTLLRTMAGFIPPVTGEVLLHGKPVRSLRGAERARRIAVVLTERPQVGTLRVSELVEMGRQPHTGWTGALGKEDRRIAAESLALASGSHLADRFVDSLSDGERQRVMIARALAQQPEVMLLDEITAFLDLPSRVTITDTLHRIARERGVAIVLSSHDLELSLHTADRLWLLPGQGRFVDGVPEDVALSGAIGEAFDQQDLVFSLASGRFESNRVWDRAIFVEGEDVATDWLRRALARQGYARAAHGSDAAHRITVAAPGAWRVDNGPLAGSVAEVIALLHQRESPVPTRQ